MNWTKIRKALVAGGGGFLVTFFTGLTTEIPRTSNGWGGLFGAAVTAAIVIGWATWRVPNAR